MAGSVNKVIIVGNLGRDPEVRHAQDGSKIVTISVATSDVWKDKTTGERRDRTEWHRVVVFNDRIADVCEKYTRKGSRVYVEGQLQTRKWTDQSGQERYTTEIVLGKYRGELTLLDSKSDNGPGLADDNSGSYSASFDSASGPSFQNVDLDDQVPF